MWNSRTVNIALRNVSKKKKRGEKKPHRVTCFQSCEPCGDTTAFLPQPSTSMKVVGSTCALKSKVGGEDMVRCLSEQSLAISKCKIPLLDEQMTVFLQDMNSCYSKLKELVPTLPTNKKASKVEILQHVIDYIWDLQVELDEPERSRQLSASGVSRTPLTTLNAELASMTSENGCSDDRIMCR